MADDYTSVLGKEEAALVQDASTFISRPLPSIDTERNAYAFHNLRFQNELNNLKSGLSWAKHRHDNELRQRENKLRQAAREDRITDKDERYSACFKDAAWRDLNDRSQQLRLVVERLNSMEWMLKSGLDYVSARRG